MESTAEIIKTREIVKGILEIKLHRPDALNALNADILKRLHHLLETVRKDANVKAILLTGEGKAFCAGADIHQLEMLNGQSGLEFARWGQKVFDELEQLGKPSVAAINGYALGGGCELAMSATLRIASTAAAFGQPEVKLGVIPGFGGTQRLARLIGKGRALDLCLTGRIIKAEEALAWGLITEIVKPEELPQRALALLESLIKLSPIAQKSIMEVINKGYNLSLEDALQLEAAYFGLCCTTRDKHEGVRAFLEKRSAEFVGE